MKKNFTLIELITVIVTIVLLAAIVIPSVQDMAPSAYKSRGTMDLKNIQTSVDKYYFDKNHLPTANHTKLGVGEIASISLEELYPNYIKKIPRDVDKFYYWVDWKGIVWIATVDSPKFKVENGVLTIEEETGKQHYKLYELDLTASRAKEINLSANSSKKGDYFNLKTEKFNKTTLTSSDGIEEGKTYFVSAVDEFGFESAPVGKGYTGSEKQTSSPEQDNMVETNPIYPNGLIKKENTSFTLSPVELSPNIFKEENISLNGTTDIPIYRMEAEDTRVFKNFSATTSNIYSSGGITLRTGSNAHYLEYTFEGTGLDLIYQMATNSGELQVLVDGIEVGRVNTYGVTQYQQKFSVRKLTNGSHTVRINQIKGTYNYIDAFDIYNENTAPKIRDVHSKAILGQKESIGDNNIIVPDSNQYAVKIYYKLSNDGKTSASVTDPNGKLVRTLLKDVHQKGGTYEQQFIEWEGKDDRGKIVPKGHYTVHIFSEGVDGDNLEEYKISITVDDSKPVYVMEAEDTRVEKNISTTETQINNSGGSAIKTGSTSHFVRYNFEGTGFDIVYKTATSSGEIQVLVDGVEVGRFNSSNSSVLYQQRLAIRNLQNGNHVVVVNHVNGTYNYIDAIQIYNPNTASTISDLKSFAMIGNLKTLSENNVLTLNDDDSHNELKFEYNLTYNGYTTALILDEQGSLVKTVSSELFQHGGTKQFNTLSWNGQNNTGQFVSTGKYNFVLQTVGIEGQTYEPTIFEVNVDNSKPSYRMEAEDSRVFKNISTTVSNTYSSGGITQRTGSTSHYLEYTFEGTGLDFIYRMATNSGDLQVLVDGIEVGRVSAYGVTKHQEKFSVRELTQGIHTVRIKHVNGTYNYIDAFDIYQ